MSWQAITGSISGVAATRSPLSFANTSVSKGDARLVSVWRLDLGTQAPAWTWGILSSDEQDRAGRSGRKEDANSFMAVRAALRTLIARQIGVAPTALRLRVGPTGKPRLEVPDVPGFDFSVTHACGVGLIAIREDGPVGVDVEALDQPDRALDPITAVLNSEELRIAASMDTAER